MRDVSDDLNQFQTRWNLQGTATWNPQTQLWSVQGNVNLLDPIGDTGELPDHFDTVSGIFDIAHCEIRDLRGSPSTCAQFYCDHNPIKSLMHAPVKCDRVDISGCKELKSLEHLPKCEDLGLTWMPDLPLLRCLTAGHVYMSYRQTVQKDLVTTLVEILNDPRWMGKGKSHMLNCALELKKAGEQFKSSLGYNPFLENAKW